jgi:hypothetical protein
MKLNALKFALAGGIYVAIMAVLMTIAGIMNIPGCVEFANNLKSFYGFYGYSVTWLGVIVGAVWGFIEGFFHFGFLAWVYNKLVK